MVTGDAQVDDMVVVPDGGDPDAMHMGHDADPTGDADPMHDGGDHDATMPEGGTGMGADWGFRPMPGGFNFENYGNTAGITNLTPVEVRRLFGPMVCEGTSTAEMCTLVPQARQWMEQQNGVMNNGHCEGLAVLAAQMYAGLIDPMNFGGGANAFALPLMSNEALQREIALWFVTQSTVTGIESSISPRDVVARLERDLAMGRTFRGTVLGVYTSPGRGNGHAVTPYLVRHPSPTTAEILVYDNNYPNQEKVVTVDMTANTWRYVTSTNPSEMPLNYMGDATTLTLTLADITPRLMLPHTCSFCGDAAEMTGTTGRGSLQVSMQGGGDLRIADEMGHMTGTDASGNIMNTIPGSNVTNTRSGDFDLDSPEPMYTVPRVGTLTVTLDGSRLTAASASQLLITGAGYSLGLENVNLDPMQRDTITVRTDRPDVQYRASGAETPTLVLAFQQPGADYLIELRSSAMTMGQSLRLAVDLTHQRVRVSFDGSTSAPAVELYMERVSETGVVAFRHRGVTASASAILQVPYAMWGGNGMPLAMEIDNDGNGTVDRTEMLTDEE